MDKKHIQPGNFFQFGNRGSIIRVDKVENDSVYYIKYYDDRGIGKMMKEGLWPIHFSLEWSLAFGNVGDGLDGKKIFLDLINNKNINFFADKNLSEGYYLMDIDHNLISEKIEYVHTFQNLIKTLTGIEAEIKGKMPS